MCRCAMLDSENLFISLVSELGKQTSTNLHLRCVEHLVRTKGEHCEDDEESDPPLAAPARHLRDLLNKAHKPVIASEHSAF